MPASMPEMMSVVHAVADDEGRLAGAAEEAQAGAHHQRVGLADKVGFDAGRKFDRGPPASRRPE